MIRLFTALPIPDPLRTRICGLQSGIDGARWVPPGNLHVTLRFIGEEPEDRVDDIVGALDGVDGRAFTVQAGDTGHFGTGRKIRAVWVGVERSPGIVALYEKVDGALVRAGLAPEGRKYTPHITVGRLRGASHTRVVRWLEANGGFFVPPFEADRFVLYESVTGRGGATYDPVAVFPLS